MTVWLLWELDGDHRYLMRIFGTKEHAERYRDSILWRKTEGYDITGWDVN